MFEPLGFGDWKPTVATVLGLVAKEEVVNVFGILYGTDTDERDTATLLEEGSDEEKEQGLSPLRKVSMRCPADTAGWQPLPS